MITGTWLILFCMSPNLGELPQYFIKIVQERTLFANDEPVMITLRLGNQSERILKAKKFPKILENLKITHEGRVLPLHPKYKSGEFLQKIGGLEMGAHRDFGIDLRRFFPGVQNGGVFKVAYEGPLYKLEGKAIQVTGVPMPDLSAPYILKTTLGDIVINLAHDQAPQHARNFAILAAMKFYADMIFHRVERGFVLQTGDPLGNGLGGSEFPIMLEKSPFLKNEKYAVGMARGTDPDSATSQFYICLKKIEQLDEGYTVFAKVVEGFDVIDAIAEVATTGPNGEPPYLPLAPVNLRSIEIGK